MDKDHGVDLKHEDCAGYRLAPLVAHIRLLYGYKVANRLA